MFGPNAKPTIDGAKTVRKSCDLCYRRKMKCDGQKPRCSHCITYEIDCTYTAPSRTTASKKRRISAHGGDGASHTQGRLGRLEVLVQQIYERLDVVEKTTEPELSPQQLEANANRKAMIAHTRGEADHDSHELMDLPPLEQILPIIHCYLQEFNSVFPLFHADTLLRLVHDFYGDGPLRRDPVVWAAINIVLALARRHGTAASQDCPPSSTCLSRAESVLPKVVLGDTQLLNIQFLVGMVMLLQASQDLKPALVLIATTIRLAHVIGLHDRRYSAHMSAHHARQWAFVFWLAYILDKDLSMRSKQPSVQMDDDINLDLPSPMFLHCNEHGSEVSNSDDAVGIITTADGTIKMNYLAARIQLATIEGGVYDYIFSTRSRNRSLEERSQALHSVESALEQWKASIPFEFNASVGSKLVAPSMLRFFGALHSTSLACKTMVNQAHAWNIEWIASIRTFDKHGIEAMLPLHWEQLVAEARGLLVLFGASGGIDRWNIWTIGCAYMSAMLLLTANSMFKPKHGDLSLDSYLVDIGIQTIDRMAGETGDESLWSFQATCTELHQRTQLRCAEAAIVVTNAD